jgi:hypothetical protein
LLTGMSAAAGTASVAWARGAGGKTPQATAGSKLVDNCKKRPHGATLVSEEEDARMGGSGNLKRVAILDGEDSEELGTMETAPSRMPSIPRGPGTGELQSAKFRALVIGCNAYRGAPGRQLRRAVTDATDMAALLREKGYLVDLVCDADRQALGTSCARFASSLSDGYTALMYFAGHGMAVGGRNYLVPVDGSETGESP